MIASSEYKSACVTVTSVRNCVNVIIREDLRNLCVPECTPLYVNVQGQFSSDFKLASESSKTATNYYFLKNCIQLPMHHIQNKINGDSDKYKLNYVFGIEYYLQNTTL